MQPPSMRHEPGSSGPTMGGRPRVGLVLGGGGAGALAFHAGALLALHHDLGWDPATADVVVGTSAGSIVGLLVRSDVLTEDLAAWASDVAPSSHGAGFRRVMHSVESTATRLAVPRPTAPGRVALNVLRHPSRLPGAMATLLPHGLFDHTPQVTMLDRVVETWPSRQLWISAVRVGDGRLTWFGRDDDIARPAAPADAVAASCAIPVLARPVRIGAHRYLDGGVGSPTNADVLVGTDLDLVVVLSPMGRLSGRHLLRGIAHHLAENEVERLRASGVAVQMISPDPDTVRAMGRNLMDSSRTPGVMRQAFLGTASQMDPHVVSLLRRSGAAAPAPASPVPVSP